MQQLLSSVRSHCFYIIPCIFTKCFPKHWFSYISCQCDLMKLESDLKGMIPLRKWTTLAEQGWDHRHRHMSKDRRASCSGVWQHQPDYQLKARGQMHECLVPTKSSLRQYINKWTQLCANITLFLGIRASQNWAIVCHPWIKLLTQWYKSLVLKNKSGYGNFISWNSGDWAWKSFSSRPPWAT